MPEKSAPYWSALHLPALLVVLFGVFLHPCRWLSVLLLTGCFILIFYWVLKASLGDIRQLFGFNPCPWIWIALGAVFGTGLAIFLRWHQARALYPDPLRLFIFMAVTIGVTEEILFRGYFLGHLLTWKKSAAVPGAALLHSAYKVTLFAHSARAGDLITLGVLTFAVGLLAGYWRKVLFSIWPCVALHALFDLWVYGDRTTPWWVW